MSFVPGVAVIPRFDRHRIARDEGKRRNADAVDYRAGGDHAVMAYMGPAFDNAMRSDKHVVFQRNRLTCDLGVELERPPVGIRDVNRNERGDVAVVSDFQQCPFAVHERECADEDVFAEFWLADDPNHRMKGILTEGRCGGEGLQELVLLHVAALR